MLQHLLAGISILAIGNMYQLPPIREDSLLSRCLDCKTQDQNEELNGMFWERVTKSVFVGSEIFQFGIYDEVSNFNIGCQASVMILQKLGISPGYYCLTEFQRPDSLRISKANYVKECEKLTEVTKETASWKKKEKNEKKQAKEVDTYEPGAF